MVMLKDQFIQQHLMLVKGLKVIDSVLMPGVLVEEGAEVYKAIVVKV